MGIQRVHVTIEGLSALLMHRFPMEPVEALEKKSKEEQAEVAAYRTPEGELYVPGVAIQRALIGGATYSKGKGRSSLQKVASACLLVSPEYVGLGVKEFAIDARAVVVPATKGRVVRYRPRLDDWRCMFTLEFDDALMTAQQVRTIVNDTGARVGLLDFRPEKKGPFGRFQVVHWDDGNKKK